MARFGASTVQHQGLVFIIGGIIKPRILDWPSEVCVWDFSECTPVLLHSTSDTPRPLFIGTAAVSEGDSIVLIGGGAVCFSFGTFWNKGCHTMKDRPLGPMAQKTSPKLNNPTWKYLCTHVAGYSTERAASSSPLCPIAQTVVNVPRLRIDSPEDFAQIQKVGQPVIIEKLDIGTCTSKWNLDYLKDQVGAERQVRYFQCIANYVTQYVTNRGR